MRWLPVLLLVGCRCQMQYKSEPVSSSATPEVASVPSEVFIDVGLGGSVSELIPSATEEPVPTYITNLQDVEGSWFAEGVKATFSRGKNYPWSLTLTEGSKATSCGVYDTPQIGGDLPPWFVAVCAGGRFDAKAQTFTRLTLEGDLRLNLGGRDVGSFRRLSDH